MADVTLAFLAEQNRRILGDLRLAREERADIKQCLQSVETGIVDTRREFVNLHADVVRLDHRHDRMDERLARIERRLDLADS